MRHPAVPVEEARRFLRTKGVEVWQMPNDQVNLYEAWYPKYEEPKLLHGDEALFSVAYAYGWQGAGHQEKVKGDGAFHVEQEEPNG